MMPEIKIKGFDGPAVNGTEWHIQEGPGRTLEAVGTRKEAVRRARNKWAAPGQAIILIPTTGGREVIRQGNPSKQPKNLQQDFGGWGKYF